MRCAATIVPSMKGMLKSAITEDAILDNLAIPVFIRADNAIRGIITTNTRVTRSRSTPTRRTAAA